MVEVPQRIRQAAPTPPRRLHRPVSTRSRASRVAGLGRGGDRGWGGAGARAYGSRRLRRVRSSRNDHGARVRLMFLSRMVVASYRCFDQRQDIELCPVTVILGRNNSGKSALVRAPVVFGTGIQTDSPAPL